MLSSDALSTTGRAWELSGPGSADPGALAEALGCSWVVATLLVQRQLGDVQRARDFLGTSLAQMPDPASLWDMERAAKRLLDAVHAGQKITVYGDYDVDGVTSTAVLWLFFRDVFEVQLDTYIPHRLNEGYGLNLEAVESLAQKGTEVLVTVDNGSSAVDEVARAQALGMDVIVIDHHQVSEPAPEAFAHLNPHRNGSPYPDRTLAAVGLAFMLLVEIRRQMRSDHRFDAHGVRPDRYLDLVALGTVADVAPLGNLNRALVRYGLDVMRGGPRLGIAALLETTRTEPQTISSKDLGFRLGPRINAAGRLDDATCGFRLLVGDDRATARTLATQVETQNRERRGIQARMTEEARSAVERIADLDSQKVLVLAGEDWHPGVVGIVASKMVEEFHRPVILLARDGNVWKGSARSTAGLNIKAALDGTAEYLMRYGGHFAAAGMTLKADALEPFRAALNDVVRQMGGGTGQPPPLNIDAELPVEDLSKALVRDIERMGPFGHMNPEPRFLALNLTGRPMLLKTIHLKIFMQASDGPCEALAWNMGPCAAWCEEGPFDLVYSPSIDTWRGREKLVLQVHDLRKSREGPT